jgi:hypothetical protein
VRAIPAKPLVESREPDKPPALDVRPSSVLRLQPGRLHAFFVVKSLLRVLRSLFPISVHQRRLAVSRRVLARTPILGPPAGC